MKKYDPQLSIDAENLCKRGELDKALSLALNAHELAKQEALDRWNELKNNPSPLAKLTKVWDSTSQKHVNYNEFIKIHNWEDDIAPAPLRIACKCLRAKGKIALKEGDRPLAEECLQKIDELGQATDRELLCLKNHPD